ncbi:MAG TPA: right-handed parallel beta-helix repeat-containing protein [Planctomycetota bacterium]|nr:right-handed parallel beta-helix repeat-containing protein [Planctomycetota bacterium]
MRGCVAVLMLLTAALALAEEPKMPEPDLKSLDPPVLLPNGGEFKTWQPVLEFAKTYYVDGSAGSDENPGTKEKPFKTIQRAAEVLQPGERVIVAAGVYREWVRPRRGGSGPDKLISYQAAPGAEVVIRGSRVVTEKWASLSSLQWVWAMKLAPEWFPHGYNPFAIANITPEQFEPMDWAHRWRGKKPYTLPRGLVFQDGRRLRQVGEREELTKEAGTYLVSPDAKALLVRLFGDADPNKATMEITTQQCVFAPEEIGLGYIHVKGFTIEHAGNPFPFPQFGALSTWRGHHWLIEGNTVRQVNGVGIDIGDQFWALPKPPIKPAWHIVRRNTVTDCGVCGIQGLAATNCLVEENLLRNNAFHPVEQYWETGSIKLHCNNGTLIRRNRIFDTLHGCGIWMDFANVNSRCCENVIVGSRTVHGGIFIEASLEPNLIDRNVIWDTQGAGIYEHDCRGQTFAHNFIGKSSGPALLLRGKVTDRKIKGQPLGGGMHVAVNNVFFDNKGLISTKDPQADTGGNLAEGIVAAFDRDTLTLTWHVTGEPPACVPLKLITRDLFGKPLPADKRVPGPFCDVPRTPAAVRLHEGE